MTTQDIISGTVDGSRNVAVGKEIYMSVEGRDDVSDKDKLHEIWRDVRSMSDRLSKVETRVDFLLVGAGILLLAGVLAVLIIIF